MLLNRAGRQVTVLEQVHLVFPDLIWSEFFRGASEVFGEPRDDLDVRPCRILSVIPTLEVFPHHFSEMGHRNLLVPKTIGMAGSVVVEQLQARFHDLPRYSADHTATHTSE
jgi:hypothetical protein